VILVHIDPEDLKRGLGEAFEALKFAATSGPNGLMIGYQYGKAETALRLGNLELALEALNWMENEIFHRSGYFAPEGNAPDLR